MIFETLIKNLKRLESNKIFIDLNKFKYFDKIIQEVMIKKIYQYYFQNTKNIRTKKIQIFIDNIKNKKVNFFNLKGILIKKEHNYLVFFKKSTKFL